jgi:hypothetical protein
MMTISILTSLISISRGRHNDDHIDNKRLNGWRSLLRGIDIYNAETETAIVASIAAAAGVDASEVDIESVAFPVKVWIL